MSLPVPHRLRDLRPAVKTALESHASLAGKVPVVIDNDPPGAPETTQENHLRTKGAVLAVASLLAADVVSSGGKLLSCECQFTVHLRTIPSVLALQEGAPVVEDLIEATLSAVVGLGKSSAVPTGVIRPAKELLRLSPEDSGCITYALYFTANLHLTAT